MIQFRTKGISAMNFFKTAITASLFVASTAQSAVVIQPTTLTTLEDGPDVQYRVFLDSAPSASEIVTITPNSSDSTEGSVGSPIQFDTSNWGVPQYISVTPGASGDGNDGNVSYTISNRPLA